MMKTGKDSNKFSRYHELKFRLNDVKLLGCMKGDGVWSACLCPIAQFCSNYNNEYYYKLNFYRDIKNRDKLDEIDELLDSIDITIGECPLTKLLRLEINL